MANREVEGLLISHTNNGAGRGTMIKFKSTEDKGIASVKNHNGYYCFIDCSPIAEYDALGVVKTKGHIPNTLYASIRDNLIKQAQKKYPESNGIIITLIEGHKDIAECITLH